MEETAEVEPEFDEMGRSRREDNTAPRSSVRVARRAARERRQMASSSSPNPDEDSFTDDELSAGDSTDLASAITSLKESLGLIFIDVKADDFRDPNLGIRKKFEEWRGKYGEEYRNAFGGLALVGVWEFWARVEMALWNPFEVSQFPSKKKLIQLLTFFFFLLDFTIIKNTDWIRFLFMAFFTFILWSFFSFGISRSNG